MTSTLQLGERLGDQTKTETLYYVQAAMHQTWDVHQNKPKTVCIAEGTVAFLGVSYGFLSWSLHRDSEYGFDTRQEALNAFLLSDQKCWYFRPQWDSLVIVAKTTITKTSATLERVVVEPPPGWKLD